MDRVFDRRTLCLAAALLCLVLLCAGTAPAQDIPWDAPDSDAFAYYVTRGILFEPDTFATGPPCDYTITVQEGAALQDSQGNWHQIDCVFAFYAVDTNGMKSFTAGPGTVSRPGWIWDTKPTTTNNYSAPNVYSVAGWATNPNDSGATSYSIKPTDEPVTFTFSDFQLVNPDVTPAFGLHVRLVDSGVFPNNTGYILAAPEDEMPPVPELPAGLLAAIPCALLSLRAFAFRRRT